MTMEPDFDTFFREVHGHAPFPWQARAAQALAARASFAVDVPTGLGKSAMVDAAVWAAGQGADAALLALAALSHAQAGCAAAAQRGTGGATAMAVAEMLPAITQ